MVVLVLLVHPDDPRVLEDLANQEHQQVLAILVIQLDLVALEVLVHLSFHAILGILVDLELLSLLAGLAGQSVLQ